ncbi:MAG: EamA family transporter [Verrucomicrobia bacterium]|nr:EamA family transporter [Verrucomicrobiota bacterium]
MMQPWLIWTWVAILCWGVWAILARLIGEALTASQQQAFSTLGLIPVIGMLAVSRNWTVTGRRSRGILWALAAGVLTSLGNLAYYDALSRGARAATVVPLTALYPLVTVLLAVVFLRERLNRIQQTGVALSLAAIYLFNVPSQEGYLSPWLLLALVPIGLWGVAALLQKLSTQNISGEEATLWFLLSFVPVAGVLVFQDPWPTGKSAQTWLLVLLLGFAFALGNFALLFAFARNGKASVIAPLAGLYPLISLPIAYLAFNERPGPRELGGLTLALLAVAALALESPTSPTPTPTSTS